MRMNTLNQARWARFRANKRGFWSLWIFLLLFLLSLLSNLIANEKPLLASYQGNLTVFVQLQRNHLWRRIGNAC